jgi:hypothetical protein
MAEGSTKNEMNNRKKDPRPIARSPRQARTFEIVVACSDATDPGVRFRIIHVEAPKLRRARRLAQSVAAHLTVAQVNEISANSTNLGPVRPIQVIRVSECRKVKPDRVLKESELAKLVATASENRGKGGGAANTGTIPPHAKQKLDEFFHKSTTILSLQMLADAASTPQRKVSRTQVSRIYHELGYVSASIRQLVANVVITEVPCTRDDLFSPPPTRNKKVGPKVRVLPSK